jgi:hypothetical protein
MQIGISEIEKRFNDQKERLLKQLEHLEHEKRSRFEIVNRELDRYKKREDGMIKVESVTSSHLKQLNTALQAMERQEMADRKRVRELTNEISRLTREVPQLESRARKLKPQQKKVAVQEDRHHKKLVHISARVREIERRRDQMKRELADIAKRETLLRQGRIYWPKVTSADLRKAQEMRERQKKILLARKNKMIATRKLRTARAAKIASSRTVRAAKTAKPVAKKNQRSFLDRLLISKKE